MCPSQSLPPPTQGDPSTDESFNFLSHTKDTRGLCADTRQASCAQCHRQAKHQTPVLSLNFNFSQHSSTLRSLNRMVYLTLSLLFTSTVGLCPECPSPEMAVGGVTLEYLLLLLPLGSHGSRRGGLGASGCRPPPSLRVS